MTRRGAWKNHDLIYWSERQQKLENKTIAVQIEEQSKQHVR
jgi:hypothetical protein